MVEGEGSIPYQPSVLFLKLLFAQSSFITEAVPAGSEAEGARSEPQNGLEV